MEFTLRNLSRMEFILTLKFFASSVDIDKECENIFERVDRPPPSPPDPRSVSIPYKSHRI